MKILFIMNTPDIVGGGQVSLLELLRLLDRARFSPYAIVGDSGEMQKRLQDLTIPCSVIALPSIKTLNPVRIFSAIFKVRKFIRTNNIALVHSNDTRAHIYAGIAAKLAGVPSLFHFRVAYSDGWYDRILPLLATKIVAVSNASGKRFGPFKNKLTIIYNGVDLSRFFPGSPAMPGFPLPKFHSPLIGTVGRIGKQKGIDTLLKTVSLLKKDFPNIGAVIAGKDEDSQGEAIRKFSSDLGLNDHVRFIGSFSDIPNFMSAIDLYALLSDN
jgi:glycosyltransferase involved in cell wall biosynthesis